MDEDTACPLADNLFDDPAKELAGSGESGVLKETAQLFIEQVSRSALGEALLGIERNTRDRLELILSKGGKGEHLDNVIVTTIEIAKEIGAQRYAPISGFTTDYIVPWLSAIAGWLHASFPDCPCTASVDSCLGMTR